MTRLLVSFLVDHLEDLSDARAEKHTPVAWPSESTQDNR